MDACKTGWIGITLAGDELAAHWAASIEPLISAVGDVSVVAIDMPIGLADDGLREADVQTRRAIGQRRSSLFMTPVRTALNAVNHTDAVAENRRRTGFGVSIQAFSLKPKILELDRWVRTAPMRVVEVHPELSFTRLAGAPLADGKTTWAGMETRRGLLAAAGIRIAGTMGVAGRAAAVDDMLDACAAAWSARRVATGEARCLPDEPEVFSDQWPCAIWA